MNRTVEWIFQKWIAIYLTTDHCLLFSSFPQASTARARLLSRRGIGILSKSQLWLCKIEETQVAPEGSLCYSLRDRNEQWSLPVANWPAQTREAGSRFAGSDEIIPDPCRESHREQKPLQDRGEKISREFATADSGNCRGQFAGVV